MYSGINEIGKMYDFPNEEAKKKIKKYMKYNSEKNYIELLTELEKSTYLLPLNSDNNEINGFVILKIDNKNNIIIFTNIEEFEKIKYSGETNFEFLKLHELSKIILDKHNNFIDGLIIDPKGINIKITREMLKERII